jgi:hypothetical protein
MAVYVFCHSAQSEPHSDPRDVCTLSLLYQLPNCNLFTQHVIIYLMERHHLWTMDPSPISFTLLYHFTITRSVYFTFITIILLPLDMLNPLFIENRWDWQPHRSWEQSSWLCCVQVSRCCWWKATHRQAVIWRPCTECHEASKHHLLKFGFLLLVWSTLVSQLRETCCYAHQTFLLGFPTGCLNIAPSLSNHVIAWKVTQKKIMSNNALKGICLFEANRKHSKVVFSLSLME